MSALEKIPTTIVTGFLGAGKTTLVRHVLAHARGQKIAVMVNEFGSLGIDGALLRACGIEGCDDDDIVELANGCLCCTVADDFVPALEKLLDRAVPPDHILIETSGLAIPKPLLKAFSWPAIRSRVTVDGVITVLDAPAVAAGRFADDPDAVAAQRAADSMVDHDNPLSEVYEDQILSADLILFNKSDLLEHSARAALRENVAKTIPRAVKMIFTENGIVDPTVLLGLRAAAENDLAARPSHHDAENLAHEHDDFESFVVDIPELDAPESLIARMRRAAEAHDILRMKGFVAVRGKSMRAVVQGVGARIASHFDRPWARGEARAGHLVVIGQTGLDRAAIAATLRA